MRRVAVFLDAGYFWVQVSALILGARGPRNAIALDYQKMHAAVLQEVSNQFNGADLLRVYWYDGPGSNGKTSEHIAIEKLDDFKLRLGTRNGVGQQKAVDGLVIADMISLTQSKAITDALLVSGDADMTPGVVAAQAMGLRVHLLSIGAAAATSPHLAAEVDRKRTWAQSDVGIFAHPASSFGAPIICTPSLPPAVSSTQQPSPTPTPGAVPPVTTTSVTVPASSSPAQQGEMDVVLSCQTIAQTVHTKLRGGLNASLLATLTPSTMQLPKEIDGELLSLARRQARRTLTETEKRKLRAEFKKLL